MNEVALKTHHRTIFINWKKTPKLKDFQFTILFETWVGMYEIAKDNTYIY